MLLHCVLFASFFRVSDAFFKFLIKQFTDLVKQMNRWDFDVLSDVKLYVTLLSLDFTFFVDV
jgi:hypothetical protein